MSPSLESVLCTTAIKNEWKGVGAKCKSGHTSQILKIPVQSAPNHIVSLYLKALIYHEIHRYL